MTKQGLIDAIAASTEGSDAAPLTKGDIGTVLDALPNVVTTALLTGDEVTLPGIGKFRPVRKEARTVKTFGQERDVPAKTVAKFAVAKPLKDALAAA